MKIEGIAQPTSIAGSKVSVHQVVSQLITSLQPLAVKRNNILLNDVPKDLSVDVVDQHMLAYVLSQLVNTAVSNTENQCIHIETVQDNDQQMLRVKDMNTHIYHTIYISH